MDLSRKQASAIRARLTHPVIDGDGHWIEFEPTLLDYLKLVGGPTMVDRYRRNTYTGDLQHWAQMPQEERHARRALQPSWWALPTKNSLDRATAMLPRLLHERMVPQMRGLEVEGVRLSPQHARMDGVIAAFRAAADALDEPCGDGAGTPDPHRGNAANALATLTPAEPCNGYWHGRAGMECVAVSG